MLSVRLLLKPGNRELVDDRRCRGGDVMAWRAIQDNVDESESLAALSHFAERLHWRLVAKADAWGRLPGSPAKVKARCVPLLDVSTAEIGEALDELDQVGRILRYDVGGDAFIELVGFEENQPRDARRTKALVSRFPSPDAATVPHQRREGAATARQVAASLSTSAMPRGCREGAAQEVEAEGEREKDIEAVRSETTGLPIDLERETVALLAAIGDAADANTPDVVRALAKRLPLAALVKVRESLQTQPRIDNRAAYAVGALQSEFAELATRRSVASVA
jgi:hypothetical protein